MSYRSQRFNDSMHSLEMTLDGVDPSKAPILSDNGEGAVRIRADPPSDDAPAACCASCESCSSCPSCPLAEAMLLLVLLDKGHLASTLALIASHPADRDRAIREFASMHGLAYAAARVKYHRHRNALLAVFAPETEASTSRGDA